MRIWLAVCFIALLAGCSSRLPTDQEWAESSAQRKGELVEVEYIEDATGLQWVSPTLEVSKYQQLMIEPVGLNQKAKTDHQLPEKVLERISHRLTGILEEELSNGVPITHSPNDHTAILRVEITRASTDMEDLKITEILPYGAIIGGTKALLGTRDRIVRLLVESQLLDSTTGELLAERVSVLLAKDILENDTEQLRFEQIKDAVERFTQDIVHFIRLTAYQGHLIEQGEG
ncbi:DUF3313 domain-containing protein [Photobacterium sanctipauli]|uniref:DUF3313 domain-containing protein n=1 Tax=Photobacterium sanctipauli TaxID=1342794 RepID=A0A2T3NNA3_9GAMM|nr:DUF3313 domain-containing protein [Photobacterium sanctipauli]PSW16948.1 DUF3313 domain-containing protein [Photobacterium sanctipauli]